MDCWPSPAGSHQISRRITAAIGRHKSCPICLTRIEDLRLSAVIRICMHAYCTDCIRRWSQLRRNCPLCKAEFDSWYCNVRVSTGEYDVERLPPAKERKEIGIRSGFDERRSEAGRFGRRRLLRRSRESVRSGRHSRQLPWRRSFGQSIYFPFPEGRHQAEVIAERILQWRASIYRKRLQAVPLPSEDCLQQNLLGNNDVKEKILQRIEPWIQRELQAILGDSDPSVIVHLAASLWISGLEERPKLHKERVCREDKYVQKLTPFLHEHADMFWHELRCFAECSFTMATYDSVVEYKPIG